MQEEKVGYGRSHGKLILMGEHSVVYGYPGIAIPFPATQVAISIKPTAGECWVNSDYYTGPFSQAPKEMAYLAQVIDWTFDSLQKPKESLYYQVDSTIPIGKGMGSSAALAVALVRGLADYLNQDLPDQVLQRMVDQGEAIVHGKSSGLDTLMTRSLNPVRYCKGQAPKALAIQLDAYLVVADSGLVGATKEAVHRVAQLKLSQPAFFDHCMEQMTDLVHQAIQALASNDQEGLGGLMTYNHYYLSRLGVSTPVLDQLVRAAWRQGALGAKLTGGGLGGSVLALASNQESAQRVRQALVQAGAETTWILDFKDLKGAN